MKPRLFSTLRCLRHENPLGLPRTGAPPQMPRMQRGLPQKRAIPGVKHIIAVSSAKGGVGKSTIAVNLALSLTRQGHRTGILDTDLFGPSIPTLLNLQDHEPRLDSNNNLLPLTNYGLKSMSIGYLTSPTSPLAWRGLLLQKALNQLLFNVNWGGLDILVLDMPPGTGDVQLTITQSVPLAGAIIISTPQDLALQDTIKGLQLFKKTETRILGLVSNMAGFKCQGCGLVHEIFGPRSGIEKVCNEYGLSLLGEIMLEKAICGDADKGRPTVVADPEGERARAFGDIASTVAGMVGL